jgi:NADPH:quinone reductase-like Zn-dependent oxidoreductase
MERLEYDHYGGPDVVHLRPFTLRPPKGEEMLVRVAAASINPLDWRIRSGKMKMFTGFKFPRAMGSDFAGTVEAVGSRVKNFRIGDTVVGTAPLKGSGAFAPRVLTTQGLVVIKPDNLSFAEAATLPIAGVTSWLVLIKKARLQRGQKLFINGAMGSVGQAAISIAREIGAEVVGRVGSQSIARAHSLGLTSVLDYNKSVPDSLRGLFDVVFDCNGSLSSQDARRLAKKGGKIIDIVVTGPKFLKAITSRAHNIVFCDPSAKNLRPVIELANANKLTIPISRTITLNEAPAQLASLERGERVNGKIIINF